MHRSDIAMRRFLLIAAAMSLPGCIDASSLGSHNVEVRMHRSMPSAGVTQVAITNVAGAVSVTAWDRAGVDIRALTYGSDQAAVDRTHVVVDRNGSQISVKTQYDRSGFFGNQNGGEVDYTIRVPKNLNVNVTNVSGPITIAGVAGSVEANDVSGRLDANLGSLSGTRTVHMKAISGPITVRIARASNASVEASTISGPVDFFFPSNKHQGYAGTSASGRVGSGSASMTLNTISGPISVQPE